MGAPEEHKPVQGQLAVVAATLGVESGVDVIGNRRTGHMIGFGPPRGIATVGASFGGSRKTQWAHRRSLGYSPCDRVLTTNVPRGSYRWASSDMCLFVCWSLVGFPVRVAGVCDVRGGETSLRCGRSVRLEPSAKEQVAEVTAACELSCGRLCRVCLWLNEIVRVRSCTGCASAGG